MRAAVVLAPADRSEWCRAMEAELEVLDDNWSALIWTWGAFGTALGWRLRADAPILVFLAITPMFQFWLTSEIFFWLVNRLPGAAWMEPMKAIEAGILFMLSLGLALVRPKLAAFSALVVAFVGPDGLISLGNSSSSPNPLGYFAGGLGSWVTTVLSRPDNPALNHPHLHNWQLAALPVWDRLWPCVCGAAVGGGLAWLLRRLLTRNRRPAFS
jgi:hypothetical protein